jgi:hypothetical protein
MKLTLTLVVSIILSLPGHLLAQAPAIQWQQSYGGTLNDGFTEGNIQTDQVVQTADGGYIFAGFSNSDDGDVFGHNGLANTKDCWVVKLDSLGAIEWQNSLGGTSDDHGYSIIQTSDGGYLVGAITVSFDGDVTGLNDTVSGLGGDFWIVKLDPSGSIVWEHAFGGSKREQPHSVIETSDGHYVAAGRTLSSDKDVSFNNGGSDIWIIKVSNTGTLIWDKSIGGTSTDYAYTIKQTPDNGFVISGVVNSTNGDFTGAVLTSLGSTFVMKLDSLANPQWFQILGGNSLEEGFDVELTPGGGYIAGLWSLSSDLPGFHALGEYYVAKLDAAGNLVWGNCYGGSNNEWFKNLVVTPDGGYALVGNSQSADGDVSGNYGGADVWVVKLDSLGVIEWQKNYGGSGFDDGTSIINTSDGGLLIGCESLSNDNDVTGHHGALSESDVWIAKLAPLNTGVADPASAVLDLSVAPVPVQTSAEISFTLKKSGMLEAFVYDVHGRMVDIPYASYTHAGNVRFNWNVAEKNHIQSGVYLVAIKSDDKQSAVKVLIQK